jgi:S-adenosylmethionine/arginine decarboxylase-like enzyme
MANQQKITFGEMGVSGVVIYCRDFKCSHHVALSADRWPDHVRLSDIEMGFTCSACGKRGADVRPDFLTEKKQFAGRR